MTQEQGAEHPERMEQGTSVIEWMAAALGGLVFIGMIAFMSVVGLYETHNAPSIKITSSPPTRQHGTYLIEFQAENTGDRTASSLVVRATLFQGDSEIEASEATIDYLPGGSIRAGGLFFKHDPSTYKLELSPVGYLNP